MWGWGCLVGPVVRPDAAWRAFHKSVDTLGYGPRNAVLEWAACARLIFEFTKTCICLCNKRCNKERCLGQNAFRWGWVIGCTWTVKWKCRLRTEYSFREKWENHETPVDYDYSNMYILSSSITWRPRKAYPLLSLLQYLQISPEVLK
jgi:hypothetical protein